MTAFAAAPAVGGSIGTTGLEGCRGNISCNLVEGLEENLGLPYS
jgi:hypothetical protein